MKSIMERKLPLVEYFYSVQGEGHQAGTAAIFIRFAGCNLDCIFADGSICDTPWQKVREKVPVGDLLTWMNTCAAKSRIKPIVIITGGEPTMQPIFDDFILCLYEQGWSTSLETNGTIWRESMVYMDHLVVSPKDEIKHGPRKMDSYSSVPDPRVIEQADEMRYVITGPADHTPPYIKRVPYHFVSPALMADGAGQEHLLESPPGFVPGAVDRCLEIVKENPVWQISLQTHKWLRVR